MLDDDLKIAQSYVAKAKSCADRHIDFSLSFLEYRKLYLSLRCVYTGAQLIHNKNWSIDRVSNEEGYTKRNSVVCDKNFNGRKKDLTISELESILKVWKKKSLLKK